MATDTPSIVKTLWAPGELQAYEERVLAQPVDVDGTILEDIVIPARGFMRARTLQPGQVIRFIDVEGQQVPDVLLYDPRNLKNCSSMSNSVLMAQCWKLTTGHVLYSKLGQPMATIVEDTVGESLSSGAFCTASLNEIRYGIEGTHSCRMNLVASMSEYNLGPLDIEEGVFVPFMNVQYEPDGRCSIAVPTSGPGDHLDLRAEMEIIVAVSNCPSEHNPCNGWNPTPLRVVIYQP
jgi:uncharacterized protein YcgI (DUF1989 family)